MKTKGLFVAALIAVSSAGAHADDDHAARRAQARLEAQEPTVREAVTAALRYAGLSRGGEAGMRRRARLAAVLPTLTLRVSRQTEWDETEEDARVIGDVSQDLVLEARATWRLDRLLFDGGELRIASLAQQRARARASVASQTTSLYYKRRATQLEAVWHPAETFEAQAQRDLLLEEMTAQLDALTGGWWGDQP